VKKNCDFVREPDAMKEKIFLVKDFMKKNATTKSSKSKKAHSYLPFFIS